METDGAISTTWAEDVAMSVWQRKTKEIQGKFPLKSQDKMEGKILIQIRYDKRTD